MPFTNPIVAASTLVRNEIKSDNFVAGVSGWAILKNGDAFFNNVTVTGGSIIVSGAGDGVFVYSGTPAFGNLIVSMASASGTDAFGNTYPQGFGVSVGAIPGTLINAGTIGTTQLAALAVNAAKIANNTITTNQIATSAGILGTQIANATIGASNIIANTITASQIAANTITAAQIAANTITAGQIAAATITGTQIAAGTITASNILASTITATQIAAGAIGTTQLAANSVTAAKIAANTITASQIAANTITASQIAANTITASQLSAGIVYAGIVDGTTITGADIVADGSNGGYFAYSGTPALGNLIGTVSPVAIATNDPLGNLVIPGVTSYGVSVGTNYAVQMLAGVSGLPAITVYTGSSPAGPFTSVADIQFDSSGDMTLNATGTLTLGSVANLPQVESVAGLAVSLSGSKQANPASAGTYPITVTNTTQTSLGFMSVPQGDVQIGTTYDIHAAGFFSTGTSVPSSATFNLHWGGITGTNIGSLIIPGTILASASLLGWTFDSEINWASTTEAIVTITVGWHTATGVGGSAFYFTVNDTVGLVTNSGNKNLSLGFVWGSAPTGTDLICSAFRAGRLA